MSGLEQRSSGEPPPPQIELRTSGIDPETLGIWSKQAIAQGDSFGPFEGDRVQEAHPDMDPSYVWEIVDLETKEHLWYIDATDPSRCNWMRNIKCARFLEEQNIISQQEGTDIYYKAMKDIPAGMELLTWYERVHLKRGRKRRKNPTPQPTGTKSRRRERSQDESSTDLSADESWIPTKKTNRQMKRELSQSSLKSLDSVTGTSTSSIIDNSEEPTELKPEIENKVAQETKEDQQETEAVQEKEIDSTVDKMATNEEETIDDGYFHFEMKDEFIVRNRQGKKLFICDICSGLYKHSFSLKRHYIKHHINHKYVSDADLQSCTVTKVTVISNETSPDLSTDQKCSEKTAQETETNEVVTCEDQKPVTEKCSSSMETGEIEKKGSNSNGDESTAKVDEPSTDITSNNDDKAEQVISDSAPKSSSIDENSSEQLKIDNSPDINSSEQTGTKVSDNENSPCSNTVKSSQLAEAKTGDNEIDTMQITESIEKSSEDNHSEAKDDETNMGDPQATDDNKASDVTNENGDYEQNSVTNEDSTPDDMQANGSENLGEADKSSSVHENKESDSNGGKDCDEETNNTQESTDSTNVESSAFADTNASLVKEPSIAQDTNEDAKPVVLMPGLYRCHTCSATFDRPQLLREHIKEHPSDLNTEGKKTLVQHQANNAKKDSPKGSKSSSSTASGKTTPSSSSKGPRRCKYCGKQFPNNKNLRRHERVHEGIRVTCEHCAMSFTQGSDLKKHIRRLHPTSFHECGFCVRYFSTKKLLLEHLQTHNKNMGDNRDQLDNKKLDNIKAIDPILDKAESMRLAGMRYNRNDDNAFKFACTVCKKRFIDYSNMCRHRRLAHLRHLMDTVKTSERRSERVYESTSIIRTRSAVEREMVDFYANVSDNIQDNLSNHMMGTKTMLDNASNLIKWGLKETSGTSFDFQKNPEVKSTSIPFLSKFNFPKPFRLKDPNQRFSDVNRRDPKYNTLSLMKDKADKDAAETEAEMESISKPTNPFEIYDEYTLPKPIDISAYSPSPKEESPDDQPPLKQQDNKTCAVCKITFDSYKEFRFHMRDEHSVNAYDIKQGQQKVDQSTCNAGSDGAKDNKNNNQGRKPDINIPVTLQHDKPEQDEVVDLSKDEPVKKRVSQSGGKVNAAQMVGMLNLRATSAATKVPQSVCTEDPTEKFHRYLCNACNTEFGDWRQFVDHHVTQHPTIERGFSIIDPNLKQVWTRVTNPVGLLNVCSAHLAGLEPRQNFHCTKCPRRFKAIEDLHKHIVECADPETMRPKYVWVYQYRKQKYSKMKKKRTCEWQKSANTPKKVENGVSEQTNQSTDSNGDKVNGEFFEDGRRRRKPFEIVYNPGRHTRRRAMTEIVNTSICGGCRVDYESISALERHIPLCSKKDKICELDSLKSVYQADNSDSDASDDYDPNKHLCIYCQKQFTYMRSLRNHIFDFCTVRKELIKENEYLDEEWEQDITEKTGGKREGVDESSMSPSREDENSKDSEDLRKSVLDKRQRRRRRGFGWGSAKAKSNSYSKQIKQVVSEDGFVYDYFVESGLPIISFDLSDTFILDVDKNKEESGNKRKKATKRQSVEVFESDKPETLTTTPPYVPVQVLPHQEDGAVAEDLTKKIRNKSTERGAKRGRKPNVKTKGLKKEPVPVIKKEKVSMKTGKITSFMKVKKKDTTIAKRASPGRPKLSPKPENVPQVTPSKKRGYATKKLGAKALANAKSPKSKVTSQNTKVALAKCVKKKIAQRITKKNGVTVSKQSKVNTRKQNKNAVKKVVKKQAKSVSDPKNLDTASETMQEAESASNKVTDVAHAETQNTKIQKIPQKVPRRKTAAKFLTSLKSKQIQKKINKKAAGKKAAATKLLSNNIARQHKVTRINNVIQVMKRARKINAIATNTKSAVAPDNSKLAVYDFVGGSSADESLPEVQENGGELSKNVTSNQTIEGQLKSVKAGMNGVKQGLSKTKTKKKTYNIKRHGAKNLQVNEFSASADAMTDDVDSSKVDSISPVEKVKRRYVKSKLKSSKLPKGSLNSSPKGKTETKTALKNKVKKAKVQGTLKRRQIERKTHENGLNGYSELEVDQSKYVNESTHSQETTVCSTLQNTLQSPKTKKTKRSKSISEISYDHDQGVILGTVADDNMELFSHSPQKTPPRLAMKSGASEECMNAKIALNFDNSETSSTNKNAASPYKNMHASEAPEIKSSLPDETSVCSANQEPVGQASTQAKANTNVVASKSPRKIRASLATMLDALNEADLESSLPGSHPKSLKSHKKGHHKNKHKKVHAGETMDESKCGPASSDNRKLKKTKKAKLNLESSVKTGTEMVESDTVYDPHAPASPPIKIQNSKNSKNSSSHSKNLNNPKDHARKEKKAIKRKRLSSHLTEESAHVNGVLPSGEVNNVEESKRDKIIDSIIDTVAHGSTYESQRNKKYSENKVKHKKKKYNDHSIYDEVENGLCSSPDITKEETQNCVSKSKKTVKADLASKEKKDIVIASVNGVSNGLSKPIALNGYDINHLETEHSNDAALMETIANTNGVIPELKERESNNIFDAMEKLSPNSKRNSRLAASPKAKLSRSHSASPVRPNKTSASPRKRKNGVFHENSNSSNNSSSNVSNSIDLVTNTVCKAINNTPPSTAKGQQGSAATAAENLDRNPDDASNHKYPEIAECVSNSNETTNPLNDSFDLVMDTVDSGNYSDATETYSEYGEDEIQSKRIGEFNGMALL